MDGETECWVVRGDDDVCIFPTALAGGEGEFL